MKKLLFTVSILFYFSSQSIAQIGITSGFLKYQAADFNTFFESRTDLDSENSKNLDGGSYQVAIDYWFRLKNKRLEFLPELSFSQAKAKLASTVLPDFAYDHDILINSLQFNFNTQIYPFDFEGDCDCPTFSKDGQLLKKGFFIRVAPGITFNNFGKTYTDVSITGTSTTSDKSSGVGYNLRAGLGIDIGVSDFITVTPLAQYTFVSEHGDAYLENPALPASANIFSWQQVFVGLRLGLRFDELNKYGYR